MSFGDDKIIRKSPTEIEKMRRSGHIVRQVLNHLKGVVAPGATTRELTAFNGWLRANGNKILIGVLLVSGAIMVGNGIFGLAGS